MLRATHLIGGCFTKRLEIQGTQPELLIVYPPLEVILKNDQLPMMLSVHVLPLLYYDKTVNIESLNLFGSIDKVKGICPCSSFTSHMD